MERQTGIILGKKKDPVNVNEFTWTRLTMNKEQETGSSSTSC